MSVLNCVRWRESDQQYKPRILKIVRGVLWGESEQVRAYEMFRLIRFARKDIYKTPAVLQGRMKSPRRMIEDGKSTQLHHL